MKTLALASACLSFSMLSVAATTPVEIKFEEFTLNNGLRVIVHEDHKAPIVAVNLWYHVGSKNEQRGRTGFAHLFEHLMFQGSENHKDEFFRPFEKVGTTGQNGTTNFDRTNYFENVPTTALDMALWMESDRMGHLLGAIDQKVLDEQRGVVQNEKRQGDNSPYGKEFYSILEGLFPEGHPYRWETIGSMEDLNAASLADVKSWFQTWYGPSNTVLVLAGDIDLKTARSKVEQYFGAIAPGTPLAKRKVWAPQLSAPARDVAFDRVAQTRVTRTWVSAPSDSRDADDLSVYSAILGGGRTSRLYQRLVQKDQLVSSVSASQYGLEIAGIFFVSADLKPGVKVSQVEAIIDEEMSKLLRDGPTPAELARARTVTEAGFIRGVERIGGFGGKADILAECATYNGQPDCYKTSFANLTSATPARLKAAAGKWLTPNHYTLVTTPFSDFKASPESVNRKAGVPETTQFPDLKFPEIQRGKLGNGIEVVLAERHEIPVVQIRMLFDGGYAADAGAKLGTANFAMSMLDEGTSSKSSVQIAQRSEELGAQIGASNTLDTSSASMSALSANLAPSLALFADIVRNPAFAQNELTRIKGQALAQIAQEKTEPNDMALRILPPLLFGEGHAYAIPFTGSGTEASVQSLTSDDLRGFHQAVVRSDNARLIISGDITLAAAIAQLNTAFGDWKAPSAPIVKKAINDVLVQTKPRIYLIDKPNAEQSVILAGTIVPSSKALDRRILETANSVFGGEFTARINMNLREDKHWAYGAYSFALSALAQRPLISSASVQSDKTIESMRELLREYTEFSGNRGATSAEIAKVKGADVRSLPGQFETASAVLGALNEMTIYGYPDNYVQTLKTRIEAQTDAEIIAAGKRYFLPQNLTWVVVGDLSKIEAGVRALRWGTVQVLDADGKPLRQ
jgi:zinc protease